MNTIYIREVILLGIVIIIMLIILGIYTVSYRKLLIRKIKTSLEEMVFIHNGIFLNNDSDSENKDALEKIEIIVKFLGNDLEKYQHYEINNEQLELSFSKSQILWDELFTTYPWIYEYGLYNGGTADYPEHLITYRRIKKQNKIIDREKKGK
ncbi:hypothetical protein HMPREF1092_03173 [Clostridium thermobutyricum]|uniref:Uncharacterized protein n=1 Tax=Clostridium thermobutyricum TaxID=29372 RepID=N9W8Y1_9CLOT|nr:hypothetical protein [Clostridium thermobutyricum]ENY99500.1 hypothetical protein HMPREF1092_03173 [Clostridium thermobutyricum]